MKDQAPQKAKLNVVGLRTVKTGAGDIALIDNGVSTRKYTWWSFLPVSLLFQFRSVSNIYFLFTAIIMLIPNVSPVTPFSAIVPLLFVLAVSEIREFAEEWHKYKRDRQTNSTRIKKLRKTETGAVEFMDTTWACLHPGDLVLLLDRDKIPADLILTYSIANNFSYVETSNLDGETNLKTREAPSCLDNLVTRVSGKEFVAVAECMPEDCDFSKLFDHSITFEHPNPDMYRFKGTINNSTGLNINNMMLRGCSMRNTPWAIGVVIYSGHESKAMLNSASAGVTPSKKTNIEKRMNTMVLIVFICQIVLVAGATIGYAYLDSQGAFGVWYTSGLSNMSSFLQALTFFILLNTIIPVSLWVSLEVLKFLQALMIQADKAMKDPERKLSCAANSMNMNEELGQVTHVFTDKTGTLTCNRMEFKGCAIGQNLYTLADAEDRRDSPSSGGGGSSKPKRRRILGFAGSIPISEKLLEKIVDSISPGPEYEFFKGIALCHSCERVAKRAGSDMDEKKKGRAGIDNRKSARGWFSKTPSVASVEARRPGTGINTAAVSAVFQDAAEDRSQPQFIYQSTSPDEAALVSAAADIGFFFHKRLTGAIQVDIGKSATVYDVLHTIAFSSERRMMSVVVRERSSKGKSGAVVVYTKGADSSVIPRCEQTSDERVVGHTKWAIEMFAEKGLRTLCVARKEISSEQWETEFQPQIQKANNNLDTRESVMSKIDAEIEAGMTLLGCTAVEDKLQPGVHETVAALRSAGITVCMITGDKRETAINIARSCKLVNSDNNVYTMSTQDNMYGGGNFIHLHSLAQLVGDGRADPLWGMTNEGVDLDKVGKERKSVITGSGGSDVSSAVNVEGSSASGEATAAAAAASTSLQRTQSLPEEERPEQGLSATDGAEVSLSPLASAARTTAIQTGRYQGVTSPMNRVSGDEVPENNVRQVVSLSGIISNRNPNSPSANGANTSIASHTSSANNKFCIVLDGAALSILLANPNQTKKLLSVMSHPQCEAAVFCRVNPKQKGLIVKSCRDRMRSGCVLAIGDGANDISMIKEAHVGIGIYGEEGWQAAGSADYAIVKFKDLYRLLFIHGRWNYMRITFFISFFVYKNFAFTFLQFWMAAYSQWTGVSVLNDICLLAFNSIFMVGPLFAAALFDKDLHPDDDRPSKKTIAHPPSVDDDKWYVSVIPRLYHPGQSNKFFTSKRILAWLVLGLVHSVCVFYGVMGAWGFDAAVAIESSGYNASFTMMQQALYTVLLMMLVWLHASMVREWNIAYAVGVIVLHVVLYIAFTAIYDTISNDPYNYIADATFGNWDFWFMFLVTVVVCVVPVIALRRYHVLRKPTLVDIISCQKKLGDRSRLNSIAHVSIATSELSAEI